MYKFIGVILFLSILSFPVTVILTDKSEVRGTFFSRNADFTILETTNGLETIPLDVIKKIFFTSEEENIQQTNFPELSPNGIFLRTTD